MKVKALIGAGGFALEVKTYLGIKDIKMFVDDNYWKKNNSNIYPLSQFDESKYKVVIAIGDPKERKKMVEKLPKNTEYFTFIHPTVIFDLNTVEVGNGVIICPYCVLTTNIKIGNHCHFNLLSTVGHDSIISDFVTTAPGTKISGNCNIGESVYFGTNSSVKEKITICNEVTVGMGAAIIKNINEPGTYIGVPAILKIKNN
jgi:sugar O-acyltransferase (sialic acid O-acetyltransferase NeuD family)